MGTNAGMGRHGHGHGHGHGQQGLEVEQGRDQGQDSEGHVSLAEAIKRIMDVRGWQTAEVARRLGEDYDRATFYRLLNGATTDPRLGTLMALCRALELSPTELLQIAGLWPYRERAPDVLDVRLRSAFAQLRTLPLDDRRRAIQVISCIAETWEASPGAGPEFAVASGE